MLTIIYFLGAITPKLSFELEYRASRFSDPDRSLNRKRKRFKVFEVEPKSNHDDVIIDRKSVV